MTFRKIFGLVALLLSSVLLRDHACLAQTSDCNDGSRSKYKLLTGQPGLNYDAVGRAIVDIYNKGVPASERLIACESKGSLESVARLSEGQATFAIVQSDVMHSVWFGHRLFVVANTTPGEGCIFRVGQQPIAGGNEPLYLIAPLYAETLHVLLRPHLNISNLEQLKGHRVWVGSSGSGTYLTAERVLGAAGLGMCDISTNDDDGRSLSNTEDGLTALANMKVDAVFFTGASPTSAIQRAFDKSYGEIHLLSLDVGLLNQLSADGSYVESMIRHHDYATASGSPRGIPTVGVQALLITSRNSGNSTVVDSFIHFFADDENQAVVRQQIRSTLVPTVAGASPNQQASTKTSSSSVWRLPLLHAPTSAAFLSRFCPPGSYQGQTVDAQESFYQDAAKSWHRALFSIGLILIVLVILYAWQRKRIGPWLVAKYPILFCAFVGIVLTWTVSSFVLWNLEGRVNGDFTSIGTSSLYLVDYLTPYFGREALTRSGQTTVTIVRAILTALFLGGLWPSLKPMLQNRLWNPLVSWMKGEPAGGR